MKTFLYRFLRLMSGFFGFLTKKRLNPAIEKRALYRRNPTYPENITKPYSPGRAQKSHSPRIQTTSIDTKLMNAYFGDARRLEDSIHRYRMKYPSLSVEEVKNRLLEEYYIDRRLSR